MAAIIPWAYLNNSFKIIKVVRKFILKIIAFIFLKKPDDECHLQSNTSLISRLSD
jgi:hypothetical protein